MKKINIFMLMPALCFVMSACEDDGGSQADMSRIMPAEDFVDSRDGKTYKCVRIGDQIWMAENLAYFNEGGTLAGCFTWNQTIAKPSDFILQEQVFCDLWNATADDPAHNWSVESFYSAEQYKSWLDLYTGGTYTQKEFVASFSGIYYRAFMDAFNERKLDYVENNLAEFRDVSVGLLNGFEADNGHYSETYWYLYSLDGALEAIPDGWRLPDDEDWMKLESVLGLSADECYQLNAWRGSSAGDLLKRGGGSGFEALMGGADHYRGGGAHLYINRDESAYFWVNERSKVDVSDGEDSSSSSQTTTVNEGLVRQVSLYSAGIWRGTIRLDVNGRSITCSVRCVRDAK